jgi:hypothetical protein
LNRSSALFCQIALLVCPVALLAQHGGHGAGTGHPSTGAANPTANNGDMSDFNRSIALQATTEQAAQFQRLTKSTEAARKGAQSVLEPAKNANKPDSSRYSELNNAVEEAQSTNQQFVRSFSSSQQSGLKPLMKKLSKADSDVSKQSTALGQELGRSRIDAKELAEVTEKLDKALTDFQTEQIDIGKEMGIQHEEHSP